MNPFEWMAEMQSAFDGTKRLLRNVNTFAIPNPDGALILETDASGIGIGAVVLQVQDGKEPPIAYYSKKLKERKRPLGVFQLEL